MTAPSTHQRGRWCEEQVEQELARLGAQVVARRIKVAGIEIDLLGIGPTGNWLVVEVKSLGRAGWLESRIHWRQLKRLRRALGVLNGGWRIPGVCHQSSEGELWFALVPRDGRPVQLIQDFA